MTSLRPQAAAPEFVRRGVPRPSVPAATASAPHAVAPRHRLDALVDGTVIQRAIAPAASPGTLGAIRTMQHLQPDDPTLDMGLTDAPANAVAPAYTVAAVPGLHGVLHATVTRTHDAAEGDAGSIYVRAGTYATNYRWVPDSKLLEQGLDPAVTPGEQRTATANQYLNMVDWDHLHVVVSDAIANQSRLAENEHLADIRLAYALTLGAADGALNAVIANMPLNGYAAAIGGGAYADAGAAQADVAARITALLPVASATLGGNPAHWLAEYQRLYGKTLDRDNNRWHTFGLNSKQFWWNGGFYKGLAQVGKLSYFTGALAAHYADVATRPAMNVGAVQPAAVITFAP